VNEQPLFPPPIRRPTRDDLVRRLDELLRRYERCGGAEARELGEQIRVTRRELRALGPAPRPPAPPRRPTVTRAHDGRLAATGERQEREEESR
jgi:hypothetical protein